jgi:hypothetical protein
MEAEKKSKHARAQFACKAIGEGGERIKLPAGRYSCGSVIQSGKGGNWAIGLVTGGQR